MVQCNVSGIAGPLCTVSLPAGATLRQIRTAIEAATGISRHAQRLCQGINELRSDNDIKQAEEKLDLALIRRPEELAQWLQQVDESANAGLWLEDAPAAAKAEPDVVLAAVAADPWALRYAAPELQAERAFMIAAVTRNPMAMEYATPEFRAERDFVLAVLGASCRALRKAAPELRAEREFVLAAVARNPRALCYAAPELLAEREFVHAAVAQNPCALEYAAPDIRAEFSHQLIA